MNHSSRAFFATRAVVDLNHPNVVQVFTVDTHDGRPYFAMEYVEGESLTEFVFENRGELA